MCLILVAWQAHPDFPLVVAANRDEFYERPTLAAAPWASHPDIVGGYDLKAGGSWLACHADGRFAAVTNVREGINPPAAALSRGWLVSQYLESPDSMDAYLARIQPEAYGGFNLLLGDRDRLFYLSNRNGRAPEVLGPGVYGLSNHELETPWPKLITAKARFSQALQTLPKFEDFFDLLADQTVAEDEALPKTGVSLELERMLSAIFVCSPNYGTRASTLLLRDRENRFFMLERSFGPQGSYLGESRCQSPISTGV